MSAIRQRFAQSLIPLAMLVTLPLCAEVRATQFPAFDDIPEALRLAPHPTLAIDRDGNWIVNGRMRYLLGAQIPTLFGRGAFRPIPFGAPSNAWLTDRAPDYRSCQRIGFDTLEAGNPMTYMKERFPAFTYDLLRTSADGFALEPGLPVVMDFTCAPWNNGRAANRKGEPYHHPELAGALPDDAIVKRGENVWVPYSVFHPEGRRMYCDMWAGGARFAKEKKASVLAYELFNEPMYNDMGRYARSCFLQRLRQTYGDAARMNRTWGSSFADLEQAANAPNLKSNTGLFVDYLKFLEDGFLNVNLEGQKAIRAIDPDARFCIQLKGLWHYRTLVSSATNLYKLNREMQVVTVSTSGGIGRFEGMKVAPARTIDAPSNPQALFDGVMERHFYRALADGKPMQNQEMYVGRNYDEILSKIWLDHVRGSSACYIFTWASGSTHWKPAGEAGAKRNAEEAPYVMLNPFAVPPENLPAIFQAKKEIFRFQEFFLPRNRNVRRDVAVLFSYPTERASGANGNFLKNEFAVYGGALDFSHYPIDVLFEEQLPAGRANRYRAIVAGGVRNVYPETVPALKKFVENGGILLLGRDFMQQNEYDAPNPVWGDWLAGLRYQDDFETPLGKVTPRLEQPANLTGALTARVTRRISAAPGWEFLAGEAAAPVLLRKNFGKGAVYLLTAEMPDYALASLLGSVLNTHGITPELMLRREPEGDLPPNVEVHTVHRGNRTAYFLYNHDAYAKLVTLESAELRQTPHLYDLSDGKSYPVQAGRATLLIPPQKRMLLGVGAENAFREFGAFRPVPLAELREENRKQLAAAEARRLQQERARFQYRPNLAQTYHLNLRQAANSPFADATPPGDGAGGWTDQGAAHSLRGVPWGTQTFLGVPCEIIRFDENDNRTCIVLKSKSSRLPAPEFVDIPVNDNLKALYFFHTAAWINKKKNEKGMDYIIRYASGKTLSVPVVANQNIWDWFAIGNHPHAAWKNLDANGFYCWRWQNPNPADTIRSIRIQSACGTMIPIVIAITAEKYDPSAESVTLRPNRLRIYSYGGLAGTLKDGILQSAATAQTRPYAGFAISFGAPEVPTEPAIRAHGVLKFEVRGGLDKFGVRQAGQQYQVRLNRVGAYGKKIFNGKPLRLTDYLPGKKVTEAFQEAAIPLRLLLSADAPSEGCNQLDLRAVATPEAGLELRNLRVEYHPAANAH